jgi:hypothetical protein
MPYIESKTDRREKLRNGETALTAGELNYQIFYHIKHQNYTKNEIIGFVEQFLGENPNYQKYNDMTGALIRCYKEVQRRLNQDIRFLIEVMESYDEQIAKYEDKKCLENGDVE